MIERQAPPLRILLLGAQGQVGVALARALPALGAVEACGRARVDLASAAAIRSAVREFKPDIIVNAAAYTAVDRAESEPDLAMAINGAAPGILAEEARNANALLVHYSTDYVFDGAKSAAYLEDDATEPQSVYGRSKLAGEQAIQAVGGAHLIFRTSWVYDNRGGNHGTNFMKTMLRLASERDHLRVVADQIGAPTSSNAIAQATVQCLARYLSGADAALDGLYHMSCSGKTSWHGFATAIFAEFLTQNQLTKLMVEAISTDAYPTPAKRPHNSVLSNTKLLARFGVGLPDWRVALQQIRALA